MGRKTFESMGRALPNRRNVVISGNPGFVAPGAEVVPDIPKALELLKGEERVFVIGGGSIYREFWDKDVYKRQAQLQQYGLYGLTDEQLDGFAAKLLEDEKQRQHLYERALDNKVFDVIRENVKLEEQEISMADFEKLFQK